MKNKKIIILTFTIVMLIIFVGISYAILINRGSRNAISIAGDIYLNYLESDTVTITNMRPMTKEEALKESDNVFNFQIVGKNTSNKDIYYGISFEEIEIAGKTKINPSDICVYLESEGNVLLDGVRHLNYDNNIYVATISKNTNTRVEKDYSLRIWLREGIIVSDTESNANYTTEEWEDAYISLKLKVNANLNNMNIPLSIETSDTFVENGKSYFLVNMLNYLNPEEENENLTVNDNMHINIAGANNNTLFTYYDSLGNEENNLSSSLDLDYVFTKKTNVTIKVYVTSINDTNQNTDINIILTKNGNETYNLAKNISIVGNNYCLNNGFNKLQDCILVSEYLSNNIDDAKTMISAKGSPDLNDTAPSYTYTEKVTQNVSNAYTGTIGYNNWYFGSDYNFDSNTGTFSLTNPVITELSNDYLNYYTCGTSNVGNQNCYTIYKVLGVDVDNRKLTLADKYTYQIASTLDSQVGLYEVEDEDGISYIYRGNVTNNNVYFGGFYWKILRTNGDGSIRLIYNGQTSNATGNQISINNTVYPYNSKNSDPTYIGYMYGDNDMEVTRSSLTTYSFIAPTTKYYFASSYAFNDETKMFTLSGNITSVPYTFSEMNSNNLLGTYPYSCKGTTTNATCEYIIESSNYVSEASIKAYLIGYNSTSYQNTLEDNQSSSIKITLENWYQTNILNKYDNNQVLLTNYLVDEVFCNERSLSGQSGNGFQIAPSTYYMTYKRLDTNKTASLICSNRSNKFTTTVGKGNGKLSYPIGLITIDELALAGGKNRTKNENYYLRSNGYYWTMSPAQFISNAGLARAWYMYPAGELYNWSDVTASYGVRPVINLSSDTMISQGDGTINNPYYLKLS